MNKSNDDGSRANMEMKGAYFIHTGLLRRVALDAYWRLRDNPTIEDITPGQNDALVSILFSAATLEAFIVELAFNAGSGSIAPPQNRPNFLKALADILDEAERCKASVLLKFLWAKHILSGKSYDKGSPPFQDFQALIALRNEIIHMKPEEIGRPLSPIIHLQSRGLALRPQSGVIDNWVRQVTTRAVARWSCNVVHQMVHSIRECFDFVQGVTPPVSLLAIESLTRDYAAVE